MHEFFMNQILYKKILFNSRQMIFIQHFTGYFLLKIWQLEFFGKSSIIEESFISPEVTKRFSQRIKEL